MATSRLKKPVMTVKTIEEAEQALAEYAKADARIAKINATMDEQFTSIRQKYADELQDLNEKKDEKADELHFFAESNAQLFDKKKSIQMSHGVIGFRTGTPKLKPLKKFTWGAVNELLKEYLPQFVRKVEEPAKDMLLANRDNEEVASLFKKVGIEVVQDETFYVDLKKEGAE